MERRTLGPYDPLPSGHSVVLMRRFAEDAPDRLMIELIVINPDGSEQTSVPTGADGMPVAWEEAVGVATQRGEEEGLGRIWLIDRTETGREAEKHRAEFVDDDLEEGEQGADLRDVGHDAAPRRF